MSTKKMISMFVLNLILVGSTVLSAQNEEMDPEKAAKNIIAQFETQYGFVPKPLLLLSERSGAVPGFMKYGSSLMVGGPLTPREINLVTLSSAVALKSAGCTQNQIRKLKKLNVSEEEIIQVVMLSAVIANTSTLTEIYETLEAEFIIQNDK